MRILSGLTLLIFLSRLLCAQDQSDSLTTALQAHTQNDTVKVLLLNQICSLTWGADPRKTRDYARQALNIARELNYTKGIADSYREMSRYYWSQTEYDKSTDFALMAIKEYERCHDEKGISWCYSIMGSNYSQANNYEKAIYYHNLALDLNTKIKNRSGIARNLNSIGYVNELKKDYFTARDYYIKALNIRLVDGVREDLTLSYANVGSIYFFIGDYSLALEYLFKALPLAVEINNKNYIALIYQNIGEVYYKTGKYDEGELYLKRALRVGNEIGDKKRKEGVYEALTNLEESRKNYETAFYYLNLLQGLRDTLYTQDRSRQMARMETLYETEKKEQTIKLLEQEKQIQTIWRNVLGAGLVLIVLATLIIYKLQRSRTQKAKQLLETQQSLNDKLKEIDQVKSRFFANISHEFRTPLTLILAPIEEKLANPVLNASDKEALCLMRRNAVRLLDLVNQLLDLSKLEAGKMVLSVKQGDLEEFITVLSAAFDSLADNKKIQFIKNMNLPDLAYWFDADILDKILTNLLSNAFKFTPAKGQVKLSIKVESGLAGGTMMTIQVSDTGKGIPKEDQALIFSPFYQVKGNSENGQPGTGLGLSIIKELTKLYGGSIELTSEVNRGTLVTVIIPVGKEDFHPDQRSEITDRPDKKINQYPVKGHTGISAKNSTTGYDAEGGEGEDEQQDVILVVEDNIDLQNFIVSVLQKDFGVITAGNGKEGIEQAFQHMPCLIVSDLMMPVLDGMALTEKIKSDERTSHIPVVLLTAKNEQESRLEGYKTGADDYLTKPFSTEELRIRVATLIEQRKQLAAKYRERITVLPSHPTEVSLDEKFLQKVKAIVENHLDDISFGVEKMTEEINLSRAPLSRKLKALTGLSPNEFIKDLRLKTAASLIQSKSDTITQICYQVGFKDQSYFTKCFKKQFGVSPSEYAAGIVNNT